MAGWALPTTKLYDEIDEFTEATKITRCCLKSIEFVSLIKSWMPGKKCQ